jgi:hypothetical protein
VGASAPQRIECLRRDDDGDRGCERHRHGHETPTPPASAAATEDGVDDSVGWQALERIKAFEARPEPLVKRHLRSPR